MSRRRAVDLPTTAYALTRAVVARHHRAPIRLPAGWPVAPDGGLPSRSGEMSAWVFDARGIRRLVDIPDDAIDFCARIYASDLWAVMGHLRTHKPSFEACPGSGRDAASFGRDYNDVRLGACSSCSRLVRYSFRTGRVVRHAASRSTSGGAT